MGMPLSPVGRRGLVWVLAGMLAAFSASGQEAPHSPVPVPPPAPNLLPGKAAPGVTDLWVVFKTHCDLGYTMSAAAVNEKYRVPMMENAIRLIEADRARPAEERFKWTIAGWPMAANILGPKQDPARKAKIDQALREGSIAVHALPCTLHTDAFELEDYVRSLEFSSRVAREHGQPLSISAKMTDVPAHGWGLATLLANAGVQFLQIGCNYSNRPPLVPQLFWWEGPDGSRILCNYTPHYGSEVTPPKDWPAKNYLAVIMTHDNEGPPSPGEVASVRAAAAKLPGIRLHFGTMDDFARAVLAEQPELPVIRGDMVDPWIHGVMSMPAESATARRVRPLEPALELLDTELHGWGLATAPIAGPLADAYENSLLYGEHTWGAMTPGWGFFSEDGRNRGIERYFYGDAFRKARAAGFYRKFEASFNDHRAFIRKAETIVDAGLRDRLGQLAKSVGTEGGRIVVFNPLPWPRSGLVEVAGRQFFAENVPAGGYKTYALERAEAARLVPNDPPGIVQTAHFIATFDLKRGGLSSLVDKKSGRELVDQTSPYAVGQFLHERFSYAQTTDYYHRYCTMNNSFNGTAKPNMPGGATYAAVTPSAWTMKVERDAAATTVILAAGDTAGLAQGISLVFAFPAAQPCVDAEWRVVGKEPDPIPEGGWLCFPFAVSQPRFLVGRLGGPIDLAKDQIVGGNRHLYGVNTGVALAAPDQSGVGLCAIDAPCLSFGEPGLWKYTFDYFPARPTVFVNLYNNMWNTNFPDWIEGSWNTRVRFWPLDAGIDVVADLGIRSWEARIPLLATVAEGPAGPLPAEQSGLSVSRPGVLVTAFGADPDGHPGTLLRVWEQAGQAGELTVTLPAGCKVAKAHPVTLRGEPAGNPLPVQDGQLRFPLGKYAPASFRLE